MVALAVVVTLSLPICGELDNKEYIILSPAQAWVWNAFRLQKKFVGDCWDDQRNSLQKFILRKDLEG